MDEQNIYEMLTDIRGRLSVIEAAVYKQFNSDKTVK